MSRGLPVPVRPERSEVIVVNPPRPARIEGRGNTLARLALSLTPDVLEALERAMSQRRRAPDPVRAMPHTSPDTRSRTSAVQHTDLEIQTWDPFPRRVRMRTTTQWTTSVPTLETFLADAPDDEPSSRLRRAGIGALGVGGALAIATLGVLANRGGLLKRR
jgi:hypothetical protein